MKEIRFSITISIISILLSILFILTSYINNSLLWIPSGLATIIILIFTLFDDSYLKSQFSGISANKIIRVLFILLINSIFLFSSFSGLSIIIKFLFESFPIELLYPTVLFYFLIISANIGLIQKFYNVLK